MPMTPTEGLSPYATVADFKLLYDVRAIGMLVDDTNTLVAAGDLNSNSVIDKQLRRASGMVESACMVGSRYDPADLLALTGNGKEYLVGLVCTIAYEMLRERRGFPEPPSASYQDAIRQVEDLRQGKAIFGFAEVEQAGLSQNHEKTRAEFARQPWASIRLRRFFGRRMRDDDFSAY